MFQNFVTLRRVYYEEKHGLEIDGEVHAKVKHFSDTMEVGGDRCGRNIADEVDWKARGEPYIITRHASQILCPWLNGFRIGRKGSLVMVLAIQNKLILLIYY